MRLQLPLHSKNCLSVDYIRTVTVFNCVGCLVCKSIVYQMHCNFHRFIFCRFCVFRFTVASYLYCMYSLMSKFSWTKLSQMAAGLFLLFWEFVHVHLL